MREKEESEKAGLKLNIQKTKNMASGLITSQQTEEEKVEAVTDFIFFGSKITVDGDCSHEIKTLAPWKESYDKPRQRIKKKAETSLYQERSVQSKLQFFQQSCMDVRVGPQRKLSTEELMILNCGVGEDS